jgi:hypothetical protein
MRHLNLPDVCKQCIVEDGYWWLIPVIQVIGRLRSKESWFETSLGKKFTSSHLKQ